MSGENKQYTWGGEATIATCLAIFFLVVSLSLTGDAKELKAEIATINRDLGRTQVCLKLPEVQTMEQCQEYWYDRDNNEIVVRDIGGKQ